MWRFWSNFQRAFRHNVGTPRPSAGVCVQEEHEAAAELHDKQFCPITGRRSSHDGGDGRCCSAKVLNSLVVPEKQEHEACQTDEEQNGFNTRWHERWRWWKSCQQDMWRLLHHSHHMLEAISVGSAVLWGTETDKRRRKTRLLYRVLFSMPCTNTTVKAVNGSLSIPSGAASYSQPPTQMAIKDAAGAAHDAAVNISKSETLDSAMEEFQVMCNEYTARNESILGLEAAGEGDMDAAVKHLHSSCMLGNSSACFNLGLCYETGSGVSQDANKAEHYYKLAAKTGHSLASYNLGLMYLNTCANTNTSNNNYNQAEDADVSEEPCCNRCGCKQKEGLRLLERAAKSGLSEAQTYLGIHHIQEQQDPARAVPYFKAAAEQNDAEAQYFLAMCYEQGWGVEINECRAAQLYSQAASAGHEAALYNLAVFNEHGLGGLPEDKHVACELYQRSASMGNDQARERLEEIEAEAEQQRLQQQQQQNLTEKLKMFHNLYWAQHKAGRRSSSRRTSSSLSPSASSPNLSDYLNISMSIFDDAFFQLDSREQPADTETKGNKAAIKFTISPYDDETQTDDETHNVWTTRNVEAHPEESSEVFLSSTSPLHRSHTYPNISMIAC